MQLSHKAAEKVDSELNATVGIWEKKDISFCIREEAELICDEDSRIVIRTATYNKRKKHLKTNIACEPTSDEQEGGCGTRNTDMVKSKCDGHRTCTIGPEEHPMCGFTFMRVNYGCESVPAVKEEEEVLELPATGTDGTEQPAKPLVVKGTKGLRVIKAIQEQEERDETVEFQKCYRQDRLSMIKAGKYLDRLTGCGDHEGCFKVYFEDANGQERWYEDETREPSNEEFLKGHLVEAGDRWVVTFSPGIGLTRSDYWSWGVCLPLNEGKEFAMATWNSLKTYAEEIKK